MAAENNQTGEMTASLERGVITIAFGKDEYIEMGRSLGRSLKRFSPHISRAIVTDSQDPGLREIFDHVIPLNPEYGRDILQKYYLDIYTPYRKTLFIDSDCLVARDVQHIFDALDGGQCPIPDGDDYVSATGVRVVGMDLAKLEQVTGFSRFRSFNGGYYYIEKGSKSEAVFQKGRELLQDFERYGFPKNRLNAFPTEELVLGVAMEMLECPIIFVEDRVYSHGIMPEFAIDVIRGVISFVDANQGYVECTSVHYIADAKHHPSYRREQRKLVILEKGGSLASLHARLYSVCYDFTVGISSMLSAIFKKFPRPMRLFCLGVNNKFRSLFAVV